MTEHSEAPHDPAINPEPDQDSEPTMTAPPEDRPDAGGSTLDPGGRADSPDVVDTDDADLDDGHQPNT
jgi:hypothetical protein